MYHRTTAPIVKSSPAAVMEQRSLDANNRNTVVLHAEQRSPKLSTMVSPSCLSKNNLHWDNPVSTAVVLQKKQPLIGETSVSVSRNGRHKERQPSHWTNLCNSRRPSHETTFTGQTSATLIVRHPRQPSLDKLQWYMYIKLCTITVTVTGHCPLRI